RAMTRALPGTAKLELAAAELRHLTGARQVTAYVPEHDAEPAPAAVFRAFGAPGLIREGDLVAVPLVADGRTLGVLALTGIGDEVLRQVAVALLREARANEEVFRIGGEEFAVVVEGDSAAAFRVAARMRAALVRQRRGEPLPTLSAGVASAPGDGRVPDDLFR